MLSVGFVAGCVFVVLRAGKPSLQIANVVVKFQGKSKLDAITNWFLTKSDCLVGPHLFGAISAFELVGALGLDIERLAKMWPFARIVRSYRLAILLTMGYAMEMLACNLEK